MVENDYQALVIRFPAIYRADLIALPNTLTPFRVEVYF
jgi:hypothetical protein